MTSIIAEGHSMKLLKRIGQTEVKYVGKYEKIKIEHSLAFALVWGQMWGFHCIEHTYLPDRFEILVHH